MWPLLSLIAQKKSYPLFFCSIMFYNVSMAKTSYVLIPPGSEESFYSGLNPNDRFVWPRFTRKLKIYSYEKKKGMTQKSLLPQISSLWAGLSDFEKLSWTNAGAQMSLNGWRLFVQDTSYRIKNSIPGVATPDLLHQSWVGYCLIEAPSTSLKIAQFHPQTYWVQRKVRGTKSQYEPVIVREDFYLPLQIKINYKSNLTAVGANPQAKFYASVLGLYQGRRIENILKLDFNLISDWSSLEKTLNSVLGLAIGYTLFIELNDVQGELWFDNVQAIHGGQNWVRDPFCKDTEQQFTRAYYQIPKHWSPEILPMGSTYQSIYYI
jgi:hypothetical protein